jgi:hypothetical protein
MRDAAWVTKGSCRDSHASLWDRLGAWLYDRFLWLGEQRGMARRRHDLLADAEGRVLEIGAGTIASPGQHRVNRLSANSRKPQPRGTPKTAR